MKPKYAIRFLILGLAIGFSSCTPFYYYPTDQNVLRFQEKGDANIAVGMDGQGFFSYNLGYSITDNVAVITDFRTFDKAPSASDHKHKIDDFLWDTELVFYKRYHDYFYPAINFGYGFGQINRNNNYYQLNIHRQFIQPSIGFSNNYFDFAISSRFTRVNYDLNQLKDFDLSTEKSFEAYYDFQDVGKTDFYFAEPAITMGIGYKFVKFRYQHIFVNKISSGDINYVSENMYLTLNFTFNINQLLQPTKTNRPQ